MAHLHTTHTQHLKVDSISTGYSQAPRAGRQDRTSSLIHNDRML
jgi:hypothetical protein